jgi:hypothetical protein
VSQPIRISSAARVVKRVTVYRSLNLKQATGITLLTMLKTHAFAGALVVARSASGVSVVPSVQITAGGSPITGVIQLQALTAAGYAVWIPPYALAGVNQGIKLMLAGEAVTFTTSIGATATTLTADVHLYGYTGVLI